MKKPSGTMGPFKISATSEGIVGEQIKILWPNNQKDIENKIFGYFKREFEKSGAVFLNVQDGGTKELDFLLTLPGGKTYLELMEVVVPKEGQIPHKSLDAYGCYPTDYANKVWEKVDKKIKKYGSQHTIAVDLLLYITHE